MGYYTLNYCNSRVVQGLRLLQSGPFVLSGLRCLFSWVSLIIIIIVIMIIIMFAFYPHYHDLKYDSRL